VDVVGGSEDVDKVEDILGTENGDETGGGGGKGKEQFPSIQKISTIFEAPLLLKPPPKNILF
jgi:hypothetical protein